MKEVNIKQIKIFLEVWESFNTDSFLKFLAIKLGLNGMSGTNVAYPMRIDHDGIMIGTRWNSPGIRMEDSDTACYTEIKISFEELYNVEKAIKEHEEEEDRKVQQIREEYKKNLQGKTVFSIYLSANQTFKERSDRI